VLVQLHIHRALPDVAHRVIAFFFLISVSCFSVFFNRRFIWHCLLARLAESEFGILHSFPYAEPQLVRNILFNTFYLRFETLVHFWRLPDSRFMLPY
jgi:hypothetical protein